MNTTLRYCYPIPFAILSLGLLLGDCLLAQETGPLVARLEMKLALNDQVLDVIAKGDLLTVLNERESSYVILTFNGQKGAVAKGNAIKLAEAVPIYDELIQENPAEGRLYTLRASAYWALGDADKALADYDKAIELGYNEAHAYTSRGLFHAATRNYDQAIKDYTSAIEMDPKDEVPVLNRASVYISTGEYEKAIEDYSSAIALRPDNPTLFAQRAIACKLMGRFEAAIQDYDRTLELSAEDVSALMGRGYLKFQLGQHPAAIEDFSKVIDIAPESAVAFNNRGYNYQILGKHVLALADFTHATELAPRYLLALQNRAWVLTLCEEESLRDPDLAIKTAKTVCEISEFKDVSDLTLLAAAYASAQEFETAIGWQEKAIALASDLQKPISASILVLYQNQLPLDPKLLDATSERPPSPRTTVPKR